MLLNNIKNHKNVSVKILNFAFLLIPVAFIVGNFAINLLVFLILSTGILHYKNDLFNFKDKVYIKYLFTFFLLLLITTIIESFNKYNNESLLRSFLFLRYFLLSIIIITMLKRGDFNLKLFLISCFLFSFLLSLNILFQYIIFPNENSIWYSGVLGDEKIAGSIIQKFFLLSFLSVFIIKIKSKFYYLILTLVLILIPLIATLISGNRVPFISCLVFFIFAIPLIKQFRKKLIVIALSIVLVFSTLMKVDKNLFLHYLSFYENVIALVPNITNEIGKKYSELKKTDVSFTNNYHNEITIKKEDYDVFSFGTGHAKLYVTAADIWNDRIVFGNGIKSFRFKCKEKEYLPNRTCGNHPHNYHLEILVDNGLLGYFLILLSFLILIFKEFNNFKKSKKAKKKINHFYCFILVMLIEFFLFKSTGSFFSTFNATFIFIIFGIIGGYFNSVKYER